MQNKTEEEVIVFGCRRCNTHRENNSECETCGQPMAKVGSFWRTATPAPYYADYRPYWQRLAEFPFRLLGLIRYDPLQPVPEQDTEKMMHRPHRTITGALSVMGVSFVAAAVLGWALFGAWGILLGPIGLLALAAALLLLAAWAS